MSKKEIDKFEVLWSDAIFPAFNQCFEETNENLRKIINLHNNNLECYKNKIKNTYLKVREQFKKYRHCENEKGILDLTKIASVICFCLVKHKIFVYDQVDDAFENEFTEKDVISTLLINYKLAFYSALNITFISLINDCKEKKAYDKRFYNEDKSDELIEKLKKRLSLKMFAYGSEHYDNFIVANIKNLAFLDMNKFDFDFMGFAIILESLKEYNKIALLSSLLKNSDVS